MPTAPVQKAGAGRLRELTPERRGRLLKRRGDSSVRPPNGAVAEEQRAQIRTEQKLQLLATEVTADSVASPAAFEGPIQLDAGLVSGLTVGDTHAVHVFKGIPFAAPPVDELRWQPPQPVKPWNDVLCLHGVWSFVDKDRELSAMMMAYWVQHRKTAIRTERACPTGRPTQQRPMSTSNSAIKYAAGEGLFKEACSAGAVCRGQAETTWQRQHA